MQEEAPEPGHAYRLDTVSTVRLVRKTADRFSLKGSMTASVVFEASQLPYHS
jgi:hypothetical protein